jgi:hypothetical protein
VTRLWPEGEVLKVRSEGETPTSFVWQGKTHHIAEVCNRWRVHTRWWEPGETIWREYWKVVTTNTGLLCLIYCDLPSGDWFLARLYD